jgi:predicted HTH transcriptional regulator
MLSEIIHQPEGRRLEFKSQLPSVADIAKTIVSFSNDAGGELFIGIQDNPRELKGLPEDELFQIEEQISSIIYERCYPVIIPDITFHTVDNKHFIRVRVYRGNHLPYYLKDKGKRQGTFVRVGSSNRLADENIIRELERQRHNSSFDGELVHDMLFDEIDLSSFSTLFKEQTGEDLDKSALKKLDLVKEFHGEERPTVGCVLFSDSGIRNEMFHYAKIECGRFKGTTSDEFIDQKSIVSNIAYQPEEAYDFVLRHINKGAKVEGVYTQSRWEYPVGAIREVIRNAIVHRDYSLTGKDIKVAIYDDMVEVTSPGKLLPSIDFNELDARQSDIRNKIIAPVFKKMGIIDQWGNGLKLISDELKKYPEIEFKWFERGMQFQVQFVKRDYYALLNADTDLIGENIGTKLALDWHQAGTKLAPSWHQVEEMLRFCIDSQTIQAIMEVSGWKDRTKFRKKYIKLFMDLDVLGMTIPDKPNSPNQKYFLTEVGKSFVEVLQQRL